MLGKFIGVALSAAMLSGCQWAGLEAVEHMEPEPPKLVAHEPWCDICGNEGMLCPIECEAYDLHGLACMECMEWHETLPDHPGHPVE